MRAEVLEPGERRRTRLWRAAAEHPHGALAVLVGAALITEPVLVTGRGSTGLIAYGVGGAALVARAATAAVCLLAAWHGRRLLRLGPVLASAGLLAVGWLAIQVAMDVTPDRDLFYYGRDGSSLLSGRYPASDYPSGAVLLFALSAALGGDPPLVAHALLMIPFHLATVAAIWVAAGRAGAWLAAFVAVWPLNLFHWELRYDLAPTAMLAVGLVLALRERWGPAGIALGVGTALKWSPAVALLPLCVWLLTSRRRSAALRLVAAFALALAVLTAPFFAWDPGNAFAAYRFQAARGIMGESIWYLPLAALGIVDRPEHLSLDVGAGAALDRAATLVQLIAVALVVVMARRAACRSHAVALAALAPAVFLLANRVFSSQFVVFLFAAWAIAAALVLPSARERLLAAGLAGAASFANALVFPYTVQFAWELPSAAFFAAAVGLTVWLVRRSGARPGTAPP